MNVHGFYIYGMYGPITDPGARTMTERMGSELGPINMHESPYRDYMINTIVSEILALPADDVVLIGGTSLGANNGPVTCAYITLQNPNRIVHGLWGFQASIWGEQAYDPVTNPGGNPYYKGVPSNVLFSHLYRSTFPLNAGLGAYAWVAAPGNTVTNGGSGPLVEEHNYPHPGDNVVADQDTFIAEMKRIIASA